MAILHSEDAKRPAGKSPRQDSRERLISRTTARSIARSLARPSLNLITQCGEMAALTFAVTGSVIKNPRNLWALTRDQMYECLTRCIWPVGVCTFVFGFGTPGMQGENIYILFGIPERLGSFFLMASVREFAPWITAMVVAGVVGTSMTADLGARRIREEFDAMEVLGVDPLREVIIPRVLSLTLMTGLFDVVGLTFGVVGGWVAALVCGANSAAFIDYFWANATTTDMWVSVVKSNLFGLFTAVVCCYKGYHASGGPMGVGKAVNQAVVASFAAIYVSNYVITNLMLGLSPDMQVFR